MKTMIGVVSIIGRAWGWKSVLTVGSRRHPKRFHWPNLQEWLSETWALHQG